jgi:CDP-diacylglycerol--serine O-phosphatidyltransferase
MKKQRVPRAVIPNSITVLSVFAGYLSILCSIEGYYLPAAWLILTAGILDMFDGRVARMVGGASRFGSNFDSLADAINYGVAPSLLFFRLFFADMGLVGAAISFLPTVCGAMRLARYNVISEDDGGSNFFLGLPTTVAAGLLASYVMFASDLNYGPKALAAVLVCGASLLMVSEVRYEHNRAFTHQPPWKNPKALLLLLALATAIVAPTKAPFAWIAAYVCFGLLRSLLSHARREVYEG